MWGHIQRYKKLNPDDQMSLANFCISTKIQKFHQKKEEISKFRQKNQSIHDFKQLRCVHELQKISKKLKSVYAMQHW